MEHQRARGCERGKRLLKFEIRWNAAVCAGGAGGFLPVWHLVFSA